LSTTVIQGRTNVQLGLFFESANIINNAIQSKDGTRHRNREKIHIIALAGKGSNANLKNNSKQPKHEPEKPPNNHTQQKN
jgi:hypothetical protein